MEFKRSYKVIKIIDKESGFHVILSVLEFLLVLWCYCHYSASARVPSSIWRACASGKGNHVSGPTWLISESNACYNMVTA